MQKVTYLENVMIMQCLISSLTPDPAVNDL